jgi:predicted DNA-binding transcriptional regulator AlpA
MREGQFPRPVCLGREDDPFATKRWYYNEVRDWLHGRPRGTGQKDMRRRARK